MKPTILPLALAVTIGALVSGCFSYSKTERTVPAPAATAPAPETAPVVQRTVYPDGSYVDRPARVVQ
jgi:hypothetical protein